MGQRKQSPNNYLLSGILWCKEHDVPYAGHTTGTAYYYACQLRKKLGKQNISCPWLKKDEAETFVLNILKTKMFTRKLVREGLEHLKKENAISRQQDDTELKETLLKISDTELKLARIWQMVESGIEQATAQERINQRNKELLDLKMLM
jgi:hypothetical protein